MNPSDAPLPPAPVAWTELPSTVHLPDPVAERIPPPEAMVHAAPAGGDAFTLAGRRARVVLDGLRGVQGVEGDGTPLLRGAEVAGLTGANLLAGPRSARREGYLGGAQIMEALVVPELLPGIALQWWSVADPGPETLELRLHLALPGGTDTLSGHRRPGLLWLARGDRGVLLALPHLAGAQGAGDDRDVSGESDDGVAAAGSPHIVQRDDCVEIRWTVPTAPGDAPTTLLVQSAPPGGGWTHLRALAGVEAHHRRGEAAAVGRDEPGIRLSTGVDGMDLGVAWARSWVRHDLRAVPRRPGEIHRGPAPLVTRIAGASGDWETGRAAASRVVDEVTRGTADPLGAGAALASWLLWTGEREPLAAAAPILTGALAALDAPEGGEDGESPVRALGFLHSAAEAAELDELAASAARLREAATRPTRGFRLPVAGRGGTPPAGEEAGKGKGATVPVRAAVADRLAAALRFRQASEAVAGNPALLDAGTASRILRGLVEELMGARPDAAFGRVTLAPLLPPHWTRFELLGLRAGEGTLDLRWEKRGGEASWQVTPALGSVPVMVILEPVVPFVRVDEILVDGQPTELEAEREGDWARLQFQIPADGQRTVTVRGEPIPATPPG